MENELRKAEGKKEYVAPTLATISLRPEEAVLGACKVLGHSGGNSSTVCGFVCATAGS